MVYAVANSSNYAQDDNFHDAIHFYNYLDNSYVLSFINHKRSNNAEQDNVYDTVNSYHYTETATGQLGRGGGGVKSSNCTQQDNVYDVASSALYTANKNKVGLKRSGPAPKQRIAL